MDSLRLMMLFSRFSRRLAPALNFSPAVAEMSEK
jgi:hypothetical protein